MPDPRSDAALLRAGGLFGLAANLVMIASLPLAPPWPPFSAPTAEVIGYFRDNHDGFLAQAWVAALGVILQIGFAGALAARVRARGAETTAAVLWGSMLAFVGAFAVNWTPWLAIAMRPSHSPEAVQALYDFGLIGQFIGVGASLALFFGAFGRAAWMGAVPRGFVVPAAIAVVLNVLLAGASATEGWHSPSGPVGMASIALFGLTLTVCSGWMVWRGWRGTPQG